MPLKLSTRGSRGAVEPAAFLDDGGAYRAVFGGESVSVQLHERELVYIYTAMTPASWAGSFFQRIQIFGPDDTEGGLQRVINDGEPEILTVEAQTATRPPRVTTRRGPKLSSGFSFLSSRSMKEAADEIQAPA